MSNILFGCAGVRGTFEGYGRKFDLIEIDAFGGKAAPKPATMRKWRKELGPSVAVSLLAPRVVSAARPGVELDEALNQLIESQRLIEARVIILATPIELTPSPLQRERLAKVVERIREQLGDARELVRIAWEPRGMWEPEAAAAFARETGLDLSVDPLVDPREPFSDPSLRYVRIFPIGGRAAYSPTRMRAMAEWLSEAASSDEEGDRDIMVVLSTPQAKRDALRLKSLVRQLVGSKAGVRGGAQVITPRGRAPMGAGVFDEESE